MPIALLSNRHSVGAARAVVALTMAVAVLAPGCKGHTMGSPCGPSRACPVDYTCVIAFDGSNQCMASCTINHTACEDGSACLPIRPGPTHVCYVGGEVPIGEACTSLADCEHGGICLASAASGTGTCFVACNLDGTVGCSGGATCTATADGNNGFCTGP